MFLFSFVGLVAATLKSKASSSEEIYNYNRSRFGGTGTAQEQSSDPSSHTMTLIAILCDYIVPLASLAVLLLLVAWIRYVKSHYRVFTQLGITGPEPSFLFGNALEFGKMFPLDLYTHWSKKYGNIFGYYEGLQPSLVVTCPELAHEILVKKFHNFSSRPNHAPFLWEREERSLQNSNGVLWKRQRQAVTGGMSGRCIREMFPVIQRITNDLLDEIERAMLESPQGFRVDALMECYSVKVITQATLGYHSNAFHDEEDVTVKYMQAVHDSASAENFATGLARLFPSLTSVLKPLDRTHKFWARTLNKAAQSFVRVIKKDTTRACPVMRSLCSHSLPDSESTNSSGNRSTILTNGDIHLIDAKINSIETKLHKQGSHLASAEESCQVLNKKRGKEKAASPQKQRSTERAPSSRLKNTNDMVIPKYGNSQRCVSEPSTQEWTESTREGEESSEVFSSSTQSDSEDTTGSGSLHLSEQDIVDLVMGLLAAGLGPLAVAMTFVLHCLAVHGEEQERVYTEIEEMVASKDTVSLEELKKTESLGEIYSGITADVSCSPWHLARVCGGLRDIWSQVHSRHGGADYVLCHVQAGEKL